MTGWRSECCHNASTTWSTNYRSCRVLNSKEELLHIIDAWAEAKRLEEFFADAERRAQDLPDEERERTIERLRRGRALIGSTDALERFSAWRAPEER